MRTITLSFKNLGSNRTEFLSRIHALGFLQDSARGIPPKSIGHILVDFRGIGPTDAIRIDDLATLALLIRNLAQADNSVTVRFPQLYQAAPSRIHRFLYRFGFPQLFDPSIILENWAKNVSLEIPASSATFRPLESDSTNYIPLAWISESDFVYDKSISIWKAHPTVKPSLAHRFRSVLRAQGFADNDTIDILTNTIFLEVGWNVVLHSQSPGLGVGICGAQIADLRSANRSQITQEIRFCLADLGVGIPCRLGEAYDGDSEHCTFHVRRRIPKCAAIVRYAFFPQSSSRPELPSDYDRTGIRGLALVASALQGRGSLAMYSGGGAAQLSGTQDGVKVHPDSSLSNFRHAGTQVLVTLQRTQARRAPVSGPAVQVTFPKVTVRTVCDFNESCTAFDSAESASAFARGIRQTAGIIVLDLGFADKSTRSLEYLVKSIAEAHVTQRFVFWNVATPWSQLEELDRWLSTPDRKGDSGRFVFARGPSDVRALGSTPRTATTLRKGQFADIDEPGTSGKPGIPGERLDWAIEQYNDLGFEVNSSYVYAGFRAAIQTASTADSQNCGFFSGRIHLLKGGPPAKRYFSLASNLAAAPDCNLRRWAQACHGTILEVLRIYGAKEESTVFVAFTGSMREVFVQFLQLLGGRWRAELLVSYDVPTLEEIRSRVHANDKVILLTDAVATGTLLNAVMDLTARAGASVTAILALVDASAQCGPRLRNFAHQCESVPVYACSCLPDSTEAQRQLGEAEYWVDPVSLIPNRHRVWGWSQHLTQKIELTIALIASANAAMVGHIVDGTRHASVYIDLNELIARQDVEVMKQVWSECDRRTELRRWADFSPIVILFPSGVGRIESLGATGSLETTGRKTTSVTVYQTAVSSFVSHLTAKWPRATPVEVLRAFDPGGGSRCSRTVNLQREKEACRGDYVIADDGLWRGSTANALIQLATTLGASRILVLPLLARVTPSAAEALEGIHSVSNDADGARIEVCYSLPLLLPIPYYGEADCPYEITQKRLLDRDMRHKPLGRIKDSILAQISSCPTCGRPATDSFRKVWLSVRAYTEMATEDEASLEKVVDIVRSTSDEQGTLAVLALFTEEWRLLGRARLRQTVRPLIARRAVEIAVNEESSTHMCIAALSLLRSLFPETFVDTLWSLRSTTLRGSQLLQRVLYHIATLSERLRYGIECRAFLEAIIDEATIRFARPPSKSGGDQVEEFLEVLPVAESLLLESRLHATALPESCRMAVISLHRTLVEDPAFKHGAATFLELIANNARGIGDFDEVVFLHFYKDWVDRYEPVIVSDVLMRLRAISGILLRAATAGQSVIPEKLEFLEGGARYVAEDVAALKFSLGVLKESSSRAKHRDNAVESARRLLEAVVGRTSTTVMLLERVREVTVAELLTEFQRGVLAYFAGSACAVSAVVQEPCPVGLQTRVFAPLNVIKLCMSNVLDNLVRHAAPAPKTGRSSTSLNVSLEIRAGRSGSGEPKLELLIRNDGRSLGKGCSHGRGGRRAVAALSPFGGEYLAPEAEPYGVWTVCQRIGILTL